MTTNFRNFEKASDYSLGSPDGEWTARLDHKAWGKSYNLILHFTEMDTGAKYWLSVFSNNEYKPRDNGFDFKNDGEPGAVFCLSTSRSKSGHPVFQTAKRID